MNQAQFEEACGRTLALLRRTALELDEPTARCPGHETRPGHLAWMLVQAALFHFERGGCELMSSARKFRKHAARSHIEHRCAVCGCDLGPKTAEVEAFARASGREQGMTEEQMNDPEQAPKICDPCWQRYSAWQRTRGPN